MLSGRLFLVFLIFLSVRAFSQIPDGGLVLHACRCANVLRADGWRVFNEARQYPFRIRAYVSRFVLCEAG